MHGQWTNDPTRWNNLRHPRRAHRATAHRCGAATAEAISGTTTNSAQKHGLCAADIGTRLRPGGIPVRLRWRGAVR